MTSDGGESEATDELSYLQFRATRLGIFGANNARAGRSEVVRL